MLATFATIMKVSVIIPVYNKHDYVEDCLRSVLLQDMDNFEVLAIDDGSTDGSGEVCDKIAKESPRLKVIHVANGGVTKARRIGYEASTGDYITFVDSDDTMRPGGLRTLYDAIVREQADEVVATYHNDKGKHVTTGITGEVDPDWMLAQLCGSKAKFCIVWAVIFKREILKGCIDDPRIPVRPGQDILMQILCLVKKPKVVFIADSVYNYIEGLTVYKAPNLEMYKAFDEMLFKAFQPRWDELKDLYTLRQLKSYETFLDWKQFDVLKVYYYQARKRLSSSHPLADRIVISMPPHLAYFAVKARKWIGKKLKCSTC